MLKTLMIMNALNFSTINKLPKISPSIIIINKINHNINKNIFYTQIRNFSSNKTIDFPNKIEKNQLESNNKPNNSKNNKIFTPIYEATLDANDNPFGCGRTKLSLNKGIWNLGYSRYILGFQEYNNSDIENFYKIIKSKLNQKNKLVEQDGSKHIDNQLKPVIQSKFYAEIEIIELSKYKFKDTKEALLLFSYLLSATLQEIIKTKTKIENTLKISFSEIVITMGDINQRLKFSNLNNENEDLTIYFAYATEILKQFGFQFNSEKKIIICEDTNKIIEKLKAINLNSYIETIDLFKILREQKFGKDFA